MIYYISETKWPGDHFNTWYKTKKTRARQYSTLRGPKKNIMGMSYIGKKKYRVVIKIQESKIFRGKTH